MGALSSGGRLARRDKGAEPMRSVTEEQRRQAAARAWPEGLPIFATAPSLLVGQRSMKDILPPRALPQRQISGNALASYFSDEFQSIRPASRQLEFRMLAHVWDNA